MKVSIILPVLDEAGNIAGTLESLQLYRSQSHEVIVVDGGSRDTTLQQVQELVEQGLVDQLLVARPGRALQMNAGADIASGDVLLFLHADTSLPQNACALIAGTVSKGNTWGRFNVRLSGASWLFRVIENMMNWRSCLTSIATGDQAMFVSRELFLEAGGFPEIRLMEDIALSKKLRRDSRAACLRQCVVTSSRRWEQHGILVTVLLMWRLRLLYFLGVSPDELARRYYPS